MKCLFSNIVINIGDQRNIHHILRIQGKVLPLDKPHTVVPRTLDTPHRGNYCPSFRRLCFARRVSLALAVASSPPFLWPTLWSLRHTGR